MEIKLDGRVALVTGASGALGRQICLYLNRAGATVVGACVESDLPVARELLSEAAGHGIHFDLEPFDVSSFASAKTAVDEVIQRHGHIDILVNCAGITRDAPLRRMTEDQWQAVIHVDLDSAFNCSRHVIDGMIERGWGRIVNIASVNGQRGQFGQTNYSAAKAGVHGFTMALAQEVARKGVTVNTVAPGYVDSPMVMAVPEPIRDQIIDAIPMRRFAQPRDIAAAVTYLCSPQASYVTGAQLPVNGGYYLSA